VYSGEDRGGGAVIVRAKEHLGRATRSGNAGSCAMSLVNLGQSSKSCAGGGIESSPFAQNLECQFCYHLTTGTRTGVAGSRGTFRVFFDYPEATP
jgi:hypothetical protein